MIYFKIFIEWYYQTVPACKEDPLLRETYVWGNREQKVKKQQRKIYLQHQWNLVSNCMLPSASEKPSQYLQALELVLNWNN